MLRLFWGNPFTGKTARRGWLAGAWGMGMLLGGSPAIAQPQPQLQPQLQQPTVAELSEVSPEHWAFQALRRLVEEYQCLQGDTDPAYWEEQLLSRFEYAAVLNACLTAVTESGAILSGDRLARVQRLQTEFGAELELITPSLEALASQVMQLEAQSFASTTQLRGEVIFALADAFGDSQVGDPEAPVESVLAFGYRVRLNFDTSFTSEDRLRIRLQGRDIPALEDVTRTAMANLGFDGDSGGQIEISDIAYQFPLSEQLSATISPTGAGLGDYTPTVNPLFSSSAKGSISNLGRENPIIRKGSGLGFGLSYDVSD